MPPIFNLRGIKSRTFMTAPYTYSNPMSTFTAVFTKLVLSLSSRSTSCIYRKFMLAWLPWIAHVQCLFAGKAKVADVNNNNGNKEKELDSGGDCHARLLVWGAQGRIEGEIFPFSNKCRLNFHVGFHRCKVCLQLWLHTLGTKFHVHLTLTVL